MAYQEFDGELDGASSGFVAFDGALDQDAKRDLPAGVKPSTAGAGRGSVKMADYLAKEAAQTAPKPVAPRARWEDSAAQLMADTAAPAEKPVSVLQTQGMGDAKPAARLALGAGPLSAGAVSQAKDVAVGRAQSQDPAINRAARSIQGGAAQMVDQVDNPQTKQLATEQTADQWRSVGEWANDSAAAIASGAVSLTQLPVNIIAPGSALHTSLAKSQKNLQDFESEPMQARRALLAQRVKGEEGFLDQYAATVAELVSNPSIAIHESLKQVAMFAGVLGAAKVGGALAQGAVNVGGRVSPTLALGEAISGGAIGAQAAGLGAAAGGMGASMTMAAGDAAGGAYDKLMSAPQKMWDQSEDYQDLIAQGMTPQEAKHEVATAKARAAAMIAAPLGVLGFMGAEASFVGKAATRGAPLRTFATEMVTEPTEEALTQVASNYAVQTVNPEQELSEGAGEAAGMATVSSGPFAAAGAINEARKGGWQALQRPLDRTPQIKALNAAGDKTAASLLQARQDKEMAAYSADRETQALADFGPDVQQRYREARLSGAKTGDAVVQTATRWSFERAAQLAGLEPQAQEAISAKLVEMPADQAASFVQESVTDLIQRGMGQPFEGMDTLAQTIEAQRDQMLDSVLSTMSDIEALEAQQDGREALAPQAGTQAVDPLNGLTAPGDAIRATELVPEGGPLSRAANLATEIKAKAADAAPMGALAPNEAPQPIASEGLRMNPQGNPFITLMSARRAAKQNPGEVVEVQGGYAIRQPQESASDPIETTAGPTDAGSSSEVPPTGAAAQGALNVQDAPQPAAGTQAQAAPGEAPAPASRDAADAGGVPDAGGDAGVRADGVSPTYAGLSAIAQDKGKENVSIADGRKVMQEYITRNADAFADEALANAKQDEWGFSRVKQFFGNGEDESAFNYLAKFVDKGAVLKNDAFKRALKAKVTGKAPAQTPAPAAVPATPGAGDAQADGVSGRPGYDTGVEVNARALKEAFEKAAGESLVTKPEKLEAWRNGTARTNPATSPVEVGFTDLGVLGINDGRHRIALAAERGDKVRVMIDGKDSDRLQSLLAQGPADPSKNPPKIDTSAKPAQETAKNEQPAKETAIARRNRLIAEREAAAQPDATTAPPEPAAPDVLGRNSQPIGEGGKPFKTEAEAKKEKRLHPDRRVIRADGGYVLASKTPKQIAADAAKAKRLRNFNSGTPGKPISAHEFVVSKGGMDASARADLGVDGNPRVGNRTLFAGQGKPGLTLAKAAELLREAGYITDESESSASAIIKRSLTNPQYTPEGVEQVAASEREAEFQDYLSAQQEAPEDFDPFAPDGYTEDAAEFSGYAAADPGLQAEVDALSAQMDALGLDAYDVLDPIVRQAEGQPQDTFNELAKQALQQAIADAAQPAGRRDSGQDDAAQVPAGNRSEATAADEGLTAPTQADIEAQQERAEQAEREKTAADKAAAEREAKDRERADVKRLSVAAADTFELGGDTMANLTGQADIFGAAEPEPAPASTPDEDPKLTQAEAAELMTWQDMGTTDGVKRHILTFYRSKADADAKTGRMTVATVTKGDRSATAWMVDGDDKTFGPLSLAKKRAMEVGMAKAVADGFVESGEVVQAPQERAAEPADTTPAKADDAGNVAMFSRSPMKSVEANVRRGRQALAKALDEKTTVHRAMFRNGLGWVDFVWGAEGVVKASGKTKGAMGLAHIIEARQRKDGLTQAQATALMEDVVDAIASGSEFSRAELEGSTRVGVERVDTIVWLTKQKGSNAWIVTAYEKNPDGANAGRATSAPTSPAASLTRDQRVAGSSDIVRPAGSDVNMSRGAGSGLTQKAVQGVVDTISARWASAPEIVVVSDMQDAAIPERVRDADAEQRSQGASGEPEGFFYKGKVYIVAGALSKPADVVRVLFHETLGHFGLRGVFGESLTPILKQLAALRRADVMAKAEEYGLDMSKEADRLQAAEEVLAVLAQTRPELDYVQRAIAAIRAFLRKNVPGFASMKMTDAEIINSFILPARRFVEVGGGSRGGMTAPAFSRNAGATGTPAFRKWFGDSKVVDAQGRPLVVYHGTSGSQNGDAFTFFDTYASNYGLMGMGGYFTADPAVASSYTTKGKGTTPTVYQVLLSIQNPLDMDAKADASAWRKQFEGIEEYHDGGTTNESWYRAAEEMLGDQGLPKYEGAEIMQDGLRAMGFDGITHMGGGRVKSNGVRHRVFIAFEPEQIKSATGNSGQFDANNTDIRFSRATNGATQSAAITADGGMASVPPKATSTQTKMFQPGYWDAPQDTRFDGVVYELQDGRIDLKRVQEAITQASAPIAEKFDARLAETLYPGRVATRSTKFLQDEVKPLLDAMAKNKVSMNELGDYLHARHAEEANRQIAKVNPDMPDGGAGKNSQGVLMTNAAAKAHIAALPEGKRTTLSALARRVDVITRGTRKLWVDEGLAKQEDVDAMVEAYKHYVPLFRDDAETGAPHPTGSGFTVKGSETKRRTGSTKEVTSILAHVLMQREAAITRAEKNRVAVALYGLALSNPNPGFWTTIRPNMQPEAIGVELQRMGVDPTVAVAGMQGVPTIKTVDPVLGRVVNRPNPIYKTLPGAIVLKINGEDRVLMLNSNDVRGLRMAESLKNLDGLTRLDIAGSVVGQATRWLASVNTQYNPAFGLVNLTRDTLGGAINLSSTALRGNSMRVLALTPAAIKGIGLELSGKRSGEWGRLFRQFQDDGGQTGYRDLFKDANDRAKKLEAELKSLESAGALSAGKAADKVLGALDVFNTTLENAVRLSAYKIALDKGMTRPKAARLARELTVDFNRKGRMGRELGPLYAFFNASVQGSTRTLETLAGPAGAKILAGGVALGVMQALLLLGAGYEEDEIPEFVKTRAFIIPLGRDADNKAKYLTIPLPLGLHVLPNTGRVLTELTLDGGRDAGAKAFAAVGEIAGAFNPLGGGNIFTADGALRTVAPTVVDPIIELATNKNFAGTQIERESFGEDPRPGFERARESTLRTATGQAYTEVSRILNAISGGSEYEAGKVSPSPERVRYLAQVVGGGLLREVEKIINTSVALSKGEETKPTGYPVFGRFYGEVDDASVQRSRYFDNLRAIDKAEKLLRAAEKKEDYDAMDAIERERPEVELKKAKNQAVKTIRELNREAMETVGDTQEIKYLDDERTEVMRDLNEQAREVDAARRSATLGAKVRRSLGVTSQ